MKLPKLPERSILFNCAEPPWLAIIPMAPVWSILSLLIWDFSPGVEQILVIGAGGAARGAIAALCRAGARKILISNRSLENARSVMRDMKLRYPDTCIDVIDQGQVSEKELGSTSLLLNTTSLGMNGERIESVNIAHLPEHASVYDMVYSPFRYTARYGSFSIRLTGGQRFGHACCSG